MGGREREGEREERERERERESERGSGSGREREREREEVSEWACGQEKCGPLCVLPSNILCGECGVYDHFLWWL